MKKRILIGSIGVVAIIVLVTFTSVVGHQTSISSLKESSPLYLLRTQRAINVKNKITTAAEYIGKRRATLINFPILDTKQLILEKLINKISKMNDGQFDAFVSSVVESVCKRGVITNNKVTELINELYMIRDNPNMLEGFICADEKENSDDSKPLRFPSIYKACPTWMTCRFAYCIKILFVLIIEIFFPTLLAPVTEYPHCEPIRSVDLVCP